MVPWKPPGRGPVPRCETPAREMDTEHEGLCSCPCSRLQLIHSWSLLDSKWLPQLSYLWLELCQFYRHWANSGVVDKKYFEHFVILYTCVFSTLIKKSLNCLSGDENIISCQNQWVTTLLFIKWIIQENLFMTYFYLSKTCDLGAKLLKLKLSALTYLVDVNTIRTVTETTPPTMTLQQQKITLLRNKWIWNLTNLFWSTKKWTNRGV